MRKIFLILGTSLSFFIICFLLFIYFTSEHFSDTEAASFFCKGAAAKTLDLNRPIKVLTWNIQFLAGKRYVFFYDAMDGSGKDEAPSLADTELTLKEVTRVLNDENPDIILLQEVDVDAKRTYYQDQVQLLFEALSTHFPCVSSSYYWRAGFVPHPHILGSVGLKLATFSKYKIEKSERHALGDFPSDIITRQFHPKRAILESLIATTQGLPFHVLNTHLEAYSQGSDLMQHQVDVTSQLLQQIDKLKHPWVLGGDFNLLMPGKKSYYDLSPLQRSLYQEKSELHVLTDQFQVVPLPSEINSDTSGKWYTHFPNDPEVKGPDRTIDFLFFTSQFKNTDHYVRSHDTLKISDHLPLIGEFIWLGAQ